MEAERQVAAGRRGPLVICAGEQTGGTGRHGRHWASPAGNVYWTILLDAAVDRPVDAGLSFAAGLAILDVLERLGILPERLSLKWPNDALLDGRKVAGVLARTSVMGERWHTIVGIGINVATAPAGTAFPAIALSAANVIVDLPRLRMELISCFMARRAEWHEDGLSQLRNAVAARLHGIGTPIRIARDRDRLDILEGVNEGLDATGALLLRLANGAIQTVVAGDVMA